jgi:hypothetical protein
VIANNEFYPVLANVDQQHFHHVGDGNDFYFFLNFFWGWWKWIAEEPERACSSVWL